MTKPVYRRVVVKVSGEALMGPDRFGIHQPTLDRIAADLLASRGLGVALAVVVGGGNIFRGVNVSEQGTPRVTGDMMGMLATVMNALALESAIEMTGLPARTMSALGMPQVCETYERCRALRHIEQGRVVLLAGGTGSSSSPLEPAIRSSPPIPQPCCARPSWAPRQCSKPPTSTASIARTPSRTEPPSATTT